MKLNKKKRLIEKERTNTKKKKSKALFQWIVFCNGGYSKIPSWDHDNLMKSKQNKSWSLILNQIDIKDEIGRKKLIKKKNKIWIN
jgi:hypothetical protein